MIEYLSGEIRHKGPDGVILDINGVGYGVTVPLSVLCQMDSQGSSCSLWIHTHVKEDVLKLFGFLTREDRQAFQTLIGINGVGPKVAIGILSTLTVYDLHEAIQQENCEILQVVPGIGKRTAEKILLELKARIDKLPCPAAQDISTFKPEGQRDLGLSKASASQDRDRELRMMDVRSALQNLSFKDKEIDPILVELRKSHEEEPFEVLVRQALVILGEAKRAPSSSQGKSPAKDLRQLF